jgi:GNAT superfamily N-acetyltransferase
MLEIRPYRETDAPKVGMLIADTYREFNLSFASGEQLEAMLGPFYYARSPQPEHRQAIAQVLRTPMGYVAEVDGEIVGVLRGRRERLASLFVGKAFQGRGIGRQLVERFEAESAGSGVPLIRVSATQFAVPFYLKMGYRRSTGLRTSWSFEGYGLPVQPMKKILDRA